MISLSNITRVCMSRVQGHGEEYLQYYAQHGKETELKKWMADNESEMWRLSTLSLLCMPYMGQSTSSSSRVSCF